MVLSICIGVGFVLLVGLLSLAFHLFDFLTVAGIVGIICWITAAVLTGAIAGGDRIRANYDFEKEGILHAGGSGHGTCFLLGSPVSLQ